MANKYLYIFRVSGGKPFVLQVKGNPSMKYDGRPECLLRTLCTEEEANQLLTIMREDFGCDVQCNDPLITPAQAEAKRNVMTVLGSDRPFPTKECPGCAWFDPELLSVCGAGLAQGQGWEDEAVRGALSSPRFQEDFNKCPLNEYKN
jgi:hypothetical protein